jgi:PPM family protein phosphatase
VSNLGARVVGYMSAWSIAAFTHRGRVRPSNEDTIAVDGRISTGDMSEPLVTSVSSDSCVLMIADGMGGHAQGAMASRAVLDYLVAAIDRLADPASCAEAIEEANQNLFAICRSITRRLAWVQPSWAPFWEPSNLSHSM